MKNNENSQNKVIELANRSKSKSLNKNQYFNGCQSIIQKLTIPNSPIKYITNTVSNAQIITK